MTTIVENQIVNDWNNKIETPVTSYLKSLGMKGNAERIGNKQYSPTSMWHTYNSQKSLAKTDIKIGDFKISLKAMNDHIMMSAKKNEAIATFMCVADKLYGNNIPSIINSTIDDMSEMITTAVSPVSIRKAKKDGIQDILKADKKHNQILERIELTFKDPVFITYFIQEALSGKLKFGENCDGSATHILYITHKPILHDLNDMSYISNVARTVDIRIDFKSSQKIQGEERGKYRYWSVLQMISKELIKDSVIYENSNIMTKSISFVLSILSDIKQSISTWRDVFDFLSVEPEITISIK